MVFLARKTPTINTLKCGCSSVDRVLASEAKGRGFDPRQPRQEQEFLVVKKPAASAGFKMVVIGGFEPPTSAL